MWFLFEFVIRFMDIWDDGQFVIVIFFSSKRCFCDSEVKHNTYINFVGVNKKNETVKKVKIRPWKEFRILSPMFFL